MMILAVMTILAFFLHRVVRMIPIVVNMTPGWESWTSKKFPMGTALGASLVAYLALAAL